MGTDIPFKSGGPNNPELMQPLPHSEIEWDVTPLSSGRKKGSSAEMQLFSDRISRSRPRQPNTG